jgi:copper(I)-binding protein
MLIGLTEQLNVEDNVGVELKFNKSVVFRLLLALKEWLATHRITGQ